MIEEIKVSYKGSKHSIPFESSAITSLLENKHNDIVLNYMGVKLHLINDPYHIKHILMDRPEAYTRSFKTLSTLILLFGEHGFGTEQNYQAWRNEKSIVSYFFTHDKINEYTKTIVDITQDMLTNWENKITQEDNKIVLHHEFTMLTLNNIINLIFKNIKIDVNHFSHLLGELIRLISPHFFFTRVKFLGVIPLPLYFKFLKKRKEFFNIIDSIIQQSLSNAMQDNENIIMYIAKKYNYGTYESLSSVQKQHLRDETVGFLVTGHETTAALMTETIVLLSVYPLVADKLREEVSIVLNTRNPSYQDLEKLSYAYAVVKEVLRFLPPSKYIVREAQEDDNKLGREIKKGDVIIISIYANHHLSKYWKNPEAFDPTRFLNRLNDNQKLLYMPFGHGERSCIGREIGMLETIVLISMLMQHFHFELIPGQKLLRERGFERLNPNIAIRVQKL